MVTHLEGAINRQATLSRDHQGPRAVLNALERIATAYGSDIVRVRQDLSIAESQLRDYRDRLGKPFAHDAYLSELTSLRDQLKAGLSATAHDASNENGPTVSELAERVKALKAANTIEATPQRVQSKQAPPRNRSPLAYASGRKRIPHRINQSRAMFRRNRPLSSRRRQPAMIHLLGSR